MAGDTIKLIATDLDGTMLGHVNDVRLLTVFRDRLEEVRAQAGTVWAVCTGRSMKSFRQVFGPVRLLNIVPDFVIVEHAFIYSQDDGRFRPHRAWNWEIRRQLWRERLNVRGVIREWEKLICTGRAGVETVRRERNRLWLRFESPDTAAWAAAMLAERARPFRHLRVFRYQRDVDVRAVPFTKGLAVAELARHLGIDRAQILAIGDGHNDISMLDPSIAGMTGCPLNATPEIVEQVHAVGGHIARTPSLEGVIEIFDAYRAGKVCSDLPPQWIPASETEHPAALRPAHKKRGRRDWRRLRKPLLLAACLYTVYVVIAIFFEKMPFNKAIRGRYDRIAAAIWNALSPRDAAPPR